MNHDSHVVVVAAFSLVSYVVPVLLLLLIVTLIVWASSEVLCWNEMISFPHKIQFGVLKGQNYTYLEIVVLGELI